jgi:hypothetical protein
MSLQVTIQASPTKELQNWDLFSCVTKSEEHCLTRNIFVQLTSCDITEWPRNHRTSYLTYRVCNPLSGTPSVCKRTLRVVVCVWNVMVHAQKPDFVLRRNGRVHLNRQGPSVQSTTGSRGVRISGSNAGYTVFRGSVKGTGYPLHSPVSLSLPLPCVTVCHHISTRLYQSYRHRIAIVSRVVSCL